MPRKYVTVSSTSSSDISLQYSSEYSRSDSRSADERRNRRKRKRRHGRSPRRPVKEPSESLHWWLARWLSSEFVKFANSVFESGKGCIRYLSNTALQALPNARTARELQGDITSARRTRKHHRRRRSSPYPGGSGESFRDRKSRKSYKKSRNGRQERASSPEETYISLKPRKVLKHGHRPHFSTTQPGSNRSHRCRTLNENWIYEENWIENLLKEVKSNFKNPVKVEVYKVTPGEGSGSKIRTDNSQTDSKISISIEELVSPTYPSGNSDVISSTSSGRRRSETAYLSTETSVTKTKGEKKKAESSKPQTSHGPPRSGSKRPTAEWGKLPTPRISQGNSISRLSPSDLTAVRDRIKDVRPTTLAKADYEFQDEKRLHEFAKFKKGDVFYPSTDRRCRTVCEDDPEAETQKSHKKEMEAGRRSSGVQIVLPPTSRTNACDTSDIGRSPSEVAREEFKHHSIVRRSTLLDVRAFDFDNNDVAKDDTDLVEHLKIKQSSVKRISELPAGRSTVNDTQDAIEKPQYDTPAFQDLSSTDYMAPNAEPSSLRVIERDRTIAGYTLETSVSQGKIQDVASNKSLKPVKKESNNSLLMSDTSREAQPYSETPSRTALNRVTKNEQQAVILSNEASGTKIDTEHSLSQSSLISAPTQSITVLSQLFPSKIPQPEQRPESSSLSPAGGPKDSSSLIKLAVDGLKSKDILNDPDNLSIQGAENTFPSEELLRTGHEEEHPALVKSSDHLVNKELTDVTEDKSPSSPSEKETMESSGIKLVPPSRTVMESAKSIVESVTANSGALPDASSSKMTTPRVTNATESATFQVPVASSEAQGTGSQTNLVSIVPSTDYTQSKENGISNNEVDSVFGSTLYSSHQNQGSHYSNHLGSNVPVDHMEPRTVTASFISATFGSDNAAGALNTGSPTQQDQVLPISTAGDSKGLPKNTETPLSASITPSTEAVLMKQQHAEPKSLDSSAVSLPPKISPEYEQDAGHQHLISFGEAEKISFVVNNYDSASSETKPFKTLERPSISKPNLPPIREEVDSAYEPSPAQSMMAHQRRPSMVTPGLLKKQSRPSTKSLLSAVSTASTYLDYGSEGSDSEYSHRASTYDRCPCKKICECCTCGVRGSEKPSFTRPGSPSKDQILMPLIDAQNKSVPKPQPSRTGSIDLSSPPVPKNSLEVLRSPFYAHWDYYDLDQDHPIARFVRRGDHAEFDNTDTILMKNVRVGGYTIPYLKLQTKEKVSSKIVCNFYKYKKLPFHGKGTKPPPLFDVQAGNSEKNVTDSKDDGKRSGSLMGKDDGKEKVKCECRKVKKEDENIWKDYTRDDRAELFDFPSGMILEKSKCASKAENGCTCMDQSEPTRTVTMPATPCESCDCFISDVELEAAPQLALRRSGLTDSSGSEEFEDNPLKPAIVSEYICGLQELCSNLCAMIGKMRFVIEETSNSGSTVRSSRRSPSKPSPQRSGSAHESPEDSEKRVRERGK